jgi:hypothetical protein
MVDMPHVVATGDKGKWGAKMQHLISLLSPAHQKMMGVSTELIKS